MLVSTNIRNRTQSGLLASPRLDISPGQTRLSYPSSVPPAGARVHLNTRPFGLGRGASWKLKGRNKLETAHLVVGLGSGTGPLEELSSPCSGSTEPTHSFFQTTCQAATQPTLHVQYTLPIRWVLFYKELSWWSCSGPSRARNSTVGAVGGHLPASRYPGHPRCSAYRPG